MHEVLKLSALEIAARIARKELSPTEVLELHIARIEQVNPTLNAMVEKDFTRARQMAAEQTLRLTKNPSELPIFFGVPFTVKEMLSYAGMKRTGGSIHHRNDVQDWDATVVARMKAAGAIPMGTTNVPELGFWFETFNPVYGRTKNPYDLSRTCGGSSGGEGALVGAGASPVGLGSDIGGSIRMPASFCGVFGHKPTRYLLPLTGHFPFTREDFKNQLRASKYPYTTTGPLARRAKDLQPLLQVLHGADGYDQETMPSRLLEKALPDWKGRKVLLCPSPVFKFARRTEVELSEVVRRCGQLLTQQGAEVEELEGEFFTRATELWFAALKSTKTKHLYQSLIGDVSPWRIGKELLKVGFGRGDYTFPNLVVSLAEMSERGEKDHSQALQDVASMVKALDDRLGEQGILLLPPHPRVAPKHLAPLWSPFDFSYTAIFTVLGHPATSIPTGLNAEGVPLGVQAVARRGMDHLTISCAVFLEQALGGWKPAQIEGVDR